MYADGVGHAEINEMVDIVVGRINREVTEEFWRRECGQDR
jgi:hypothetical protein